MNIEKYKFEPSDLVVVTAVTAYLKNLKPEVRKETLAGVIRQHGAETVIDGPALIRLIENAKATAMIGSEAWSDGEDIYQKTLDFIREALPAIDGTEYIKNPPEQFLRFIEDWSAE